MKWIARIPKAAAAGHYLTGAMSLAKSDAARKVAQYPVTYHIGAPIRPGRVKTQTESAQIATLYSPEKRARPMTKMQQLDGRDHLARRINE